MSSYAVPVSSSQSAESHSGDMEGRDSKHDFSHSPSDGRPGLTTSHRGDSQGK